MAVTASPIIMTMICMRNKNKTELSLTYLPIPILSVYWSCCLNWSLQNRKSCTTPNWLINSNCFYYFKGLRVLLISRFAGREQKQFYVRMWTLFDVNTLTEHSSDCVRLSVATHVQLLTQFTGNKTHLRFIRSLIIVSLGSLSLSHSLSVVFLPSTRKS